MNCKPEIIIKQPNEKKDKLIQWYGWITIIILCITPIVFILLPILMVNTNKINHLLKESRVYENNSLTGIVTEANWELKNEYGIDSIVGELKVKTDKGDIINCSFLKYVGKNSKTLPKIKVADHLNLTGILDYSTNLFKVRNVHNLSNNKIYTSEPTLSVY